GQSRRRERGVDCPGAGGFPKSLTRLVTMWFAVRPVRPCALHPLSAGRPSYLRIFTKSPSLGSISIRPPLPCPKVAGLVFCSWTRGLGALASGRGSVAPSSGSESGASVFCPGTYQVVRFSSQVP